MLDHHLTVYADQFTPAGAGLIPTGELQNVAGTPFDFRTPQRIGSRIQQEDPQLQMAGGYDHNYVLRNPYLTHSDLRHAATLFDPHSGRVLETFTTEPGVQVYSGNFLGEGSGHVRHGAICLETQHFPDTPNQPHFPSTVLLPDRFFRQKPPMLSNAVR